jgi:hypothetical protein
MEGGTPVGSDSIFGYFPAGTKPSGNPHDNSRRGEVIGYSRPKSDNPFDDVPMGKCPFCEADFSGKRNPMSAVNGHCLAKTSDGEHFPLSHYKG